jgi:homoserine kinase type II
MSVFVRGTSYQQGNREHLRQVAWALASYHRAAASFRPPCLGVATPFLPHGLAKRLQELSSWERPSGTAVDGHPLLRDALACVPFLVEKGREALRLLEETYPQLPPAVIHGACRRGSAIFDGDSLVALAVAVHDLGKVYDEPGSPTHKVALDLDRVREFLAAYQELSPLEPAELSALPAMLVAKRVRRALGRCHRLARGEPVSDGDLRKVLLETARVRWLDANGRELRDALGRPLAGPAQVERR